MKNKTFKAFFKKVNKKNKNKLINKKLWYLKKFSFKERSVLEYLHKVVWSDKKNEHTEWKWIILLRA